MFAKPPVGPAIPPPGGTTLDGDSKRGPYPPTPKWGCAAVGDSFEPCVTEFGPEESPPLPPLAEEPPIVREFMAGEKSAEADGPNGPPEAHGPAPPVAFLDMVGEACVEEDDGMKSLEAGLRPEGEGAPPVPVPLAAPVVKPEER